MITNFEEETHDLTTHEKDVLLPLMVKGLKNKVGKENAVTSKQIIRGFKNSGYSMDGPRVRKLVNYIRVKSLIPCLMATNKGYHITNDKAELESFLKSLDERIWAIRAVRDAVGRQLDEKFHNTEA
jgi:hypothetical protein